MTTNETNAETTLHQQEMQQRRENILDLLDIMDEGNLTALRFKDGSVEIELERTPAPGGISSSTLPLMAERVGQLLNAREDLTGVTAGAASAPMPAEDDSVSVVRSPMVGTFYAGPSPEFYTSPYSSRSTWGPAPTKSHSSRWAKRCLPARRWPSWKP